LSFYSSRRRHTRSKRDWSSDVCSSDLKYTWFSAFWQIYFRHFGSYFFGYLALLYFFHQYTASIAETEPASFHFNFFNTSPMSPSIQTERSAISFRAAASP